MKIRPEIPIILCTGYSERITEDRAKKIGIFDLAMKPLLIHDLVKVGPKWLPTEKMPVLVAGIHIAVSPLGQAPRWSSRP